MHNGVIGLLNERKLDSILLANSTEKRDSSFVYFTGIDMVTRYLVITNSKKVLFGSPLEYGIAKRYSIVRDIRLIDKDVYENIKRISGKRIGVNYDNISVSGFKRMKKNLKARLIDASEMLAGLRAVKRKDEIEKIEKACRITDSIYKRIFRDAKSMRTEQEMKDAIEEMMRCYNVVPSFEVIVASGKHGANPHHVSDSNKLKGMTVIDVGVKVKNYCSDMTRTICFGNPRRDELDAYHLVKSVQEACVRMVRSGENFNVINRYALHSVGKGMMHGVGHGLGIDVHEAPFISKEKSILKEGMVITIEPGIYIKNKFGIRIEDDVAVEKERGRVLSKTGKELLIVS